MPFENVRQLADAIESDGGTHTQYFYKTNGPSAVGAGRWCDLSMGAGQPKYNAYPASQGSLTATPLTGAGNDGIYLGPNPGAGKTRHLHRIQMQSSSATLAPATFLLCDYLMQYPLVDADSTDLQAMDNTLALTRYTTGVGVMVMLVCTTPMTSVASVTVSYTNQAGVSGRTSTSSLRFSAVIGGILCSSFDINSANSVSPFIPLASGDTGVRSVESVTISAAAGGFFSVVLVKPISTITLRENFTAAEVVQFTQRADLPVVYDGAYLNFIYLTNVSGTAAPLTGFLEFVWR